MGNSYHIYLEIKCADGKWHCMDGYYNCRETNTLRLAETFWSMSRSYFSKTYEKLCSLGHKIHVNDLSEEVRAAQAGDESDCEVISVSLSAFNEQYYSMIKSHHQCCGYVHKSDLWAYEVEGDEIDEWLTAEEYDKLTESKKKEYVFYEWDLAYDWPFHFKEIKKNLEFVISKYYSIGNKWNSDDPVRLVCIVY